jgi:hypothetical protein
MNEWKKEGVYQVALDMHSYPLSRMFKKYAVVKKSKLLNE